jgi:hypothetical protein
MTAMKPTWRNIADLANNRFSEIPRDDSGIYVVRWSKERKPTPIQRLGGKDENGILYIGSAKKLRRRIRTLWNGINGRGKHTMGQTITFCKLREIIRPDEFEVTWESVKDHDIALGQEWAAIVDYSQRFREPPPLNLNLSRTKYGLADLAEVGKSKFAYESDEFVLALLK